VKLASILLLAAVLSAPRASAADWPQFMRDSKHSGNAADESLKMPLGLVAQVKLLDAVMTSPAVVGGKVYVVDQMGTAYCVDPGARRIVWKQSPEGAKAMGSNTSSPCVVKGRVYYGTTAGNLHILNASDGKLVKTVKVGSPIISAITHANDAIYFQAMDAVLRCLDLGGKEKWTWDHYKRYKEPPETTRKNAKGRGHPGSYDRPHHGGGEVAVSGKKVVTSMGWDIFCLEDLGKNAKILWCRRAPAGRDGAAPMSPSIAGDSVYAAGMGADGCLQLMRLSMKDGSYVKNQARCKPYPWITPAVRGSAVTTRGLGWLKDSIGLYDPDAKKSLGGWQHKTMATPVMTSHALARKHLLLTTLNGELLAIGIGAGRAKTPFKFDTPNGKGIGSSPAVSGGRVYFGCDDGYLYVLGAGGSLRATKDAKLAIHERKSKADSPTGKKYAWSSPLADAANTCFVDDPGIGPQLKMRWAARGFGHFKTPCIATREGDLISVTLQRTVTCREGATGRLRWRRRLPTDTPQWARSAGLLVAGGRLYVPCPWPRGGKLFCLDMKTGENLWSAPIGDRGIWDRAAPVIADGVLAFGHVQKGKAPVVEAWNAASGKPAWKVIVNTNSGAPGGCTDGKVFYFSAGREKWGWKPKGDMKRGEAVAIEAGSGKVLWRNSEVFGTGHAFMRGNQLFLQERSKGLQCVDPRTGKLKWRGGATHVKHFSLGADYIVSRGYGGAAGNIRTVDGKSAGRGQLGGATHACGPVGLTPRYSFAITVGGLNVRDAKTGKLMWLSSGFAPRGCVNVTLSNGRVFWPSAASGVIYCWETAGK
jgi:outer membrane protein assembly factor BamB